MRRVRKENVVRNGCGEVRREKCNARAVVLVFRVAFTRGERRVERDGRDEDNQISILLSLSLSEQTKYDSTLTFMFCFRCKLQYVDTYFFLNQN